MANLQKVQPSTPRAKSSKAAAPARKGAKEVTRDMVAARAYELWQERGCVEGSEQDDWYQAERELASPHDE